MVYLVKKGFDPLDPATLENPSAIFLQADEMVKNPDGSVSFRRGNMFLGQYPNVYGSRDDNTVLGVYQKFTKDGSLVTTQTRPGDKLFVYVLVQGRTY